MYREVPSLQGRIGLILATLMEPARSSVYHLLNRFARINSRRFESVDLHKRSVVFAPHPDDETLGCGGTIARMTDLETEVHIVFVTDGASSSGERLPKYELASIRRQEAIEASRRLGVPPSRLHFLNAADGSLKTERTKSQEEISHILEVHRPEQIFAPYHREPPPDHWVTFEIVKDAADECLDRLPLYGYPIWFWLRWPFADISLSLNWHSLSSELRKALRGAQGIFLELKHHVDIEDVLDRKRFALSAHQTQVTRFDDSEDWTVLSDVSHGTWLDNMLNFDEYFSCTWVGK